MIEVGEALPNFSVGQAGGDADTFRLATGLGSGPLVFVFFPGAFSSTCTTELRTFQDRRPAFAAAGGQLYGVSVDTVWVLRTFRAEHGLEFPLLSDIDRTIIRATGLTTDFDDMGMHDLAARAVLVADETGTVTWRWRGAPADEPDYDAVLESTKRTARTAD